MDAAEASSRLVFPIVLPATWPENRKPGSNTSRLLPLPLKLAAVPPVPTMVPAFVRVPPVTRTPMLPVIEAPPALVTVPAADTTPTPCVPVAEMTP